MILLALALVLAILGSAIRFALLRARDRFSSTEQSHRILIPAACFTLGVTFYSMLALSGWAPIAFLIMTVLAAFIINGVGSLAVIAVMDLSARALGALRTRIWLLTGTGILVATTLFATLVVGGEAASRGLGALRDPDFISMIALSVSAGLLWWSYLPVAAPVADVFE